MTREKKREKAVGRTHISIHGHLGSDGDHSNKNTCEKGEEKRKKARQKKREEMRAT